MNTLLGGDGSPSDSCIINGGTATGTTAVIVRNAGGGGALTTGDGILVIDAVERRHHGARRIRRRRLRRPLRVSAVPWQHRRARSAATTGILRSNLPPEPPCRAAWAADTELSPGGVAL